MPAPSSVYASAMEGQFQRHGRPMPWRWRVHGGGRVYRSAMQGPWQRHGQAMEGPWFVHWGSMEHHGEAMEGPWRVLEGTYSAWRVHGGFVACPWRVHGTFVEDPWTFYGNPWRVYAWYMARQRTVQRDSMAPP